MPQWVQQFHEWWPYFRVAVLHDIGTFKDGPKQKLINKIVACNGILLTTYSSLLIYENDLLKHNWHYVILDEGHKIRNPDAKITVTVKCFRTPHRIILSGSPIQNNLKELWSLFDFIFPGKLGTLTAFMENFSVPIVQGGYSNASEIQVKTAYKCASVLKDTITPYLLRRIKTDIQSTLDLPSKNEQVLFCSLTDEQKQEYIKYIKSAECQNVMHKKNAIFKALVHLRKICNHADIVKAEYREFTHDSYGHYKRSGKMIVVETLLKLWKKQNNRVLLFSQSRKMLEILEIFLKKENYEYLRMDGTTPAGTRQVLVNRFNSDASIFVFLLTTKVGGLGLNLTSANRIIIYDPDWNPSTDMQARERSWRIGQKKNVTIYRLLTTGTIEEKIYHRQIFKQFLTNKVLKDPRQKRFFKTNDLYELFSYSALENNEVSTTETSDIFCGTGSEVKIKKKKKSKNKSIDGELVPNLDKKLDYNASSNDDEERQKQIQEDKQKDDYVLSKLLKVKHGKAKIQTALHHDKIVDSSEPDYALVESEADRVAQEALKNLRQSRSLCNSAESGRPNLVGIRFGNKTKFGFTNISSSSASDDSLKSNFSSEAMSSASLLNRIKARNNVVVNLDDNQKAKISEPGDKFTNLAKELREYLLFNSSNHLKATTEEIVQYFGNKLENYDSAKFKAILKQMCVFSREKNNIGTWQLKNEYK